jgi:hypothetical protein
MKVGDTPGTIVADISQLEGQVPTAVKYAWGSTNCCAWRVAAPHHTTEKAIVTQKISVELVINSNHHANHIRVDLQVT